MDFWLVVSTIHDLLRSPGAREAWHTRCVEGQRAGNVVSAFLPHVGGPWNSSKQTPIYVYIYICVYIHTYCSLGRCQTGSIKSSLRACDGLDCSGSSGGRSYNFRQLNSAIGEPLPNPAVFKELAGLNNKDQQASKSRRLRSQPTQSQCFRSVQKIQLPIHQTEASECP